MKKLFLFLFFPLSVFAAELEFKFPSVEKTFTTKELLKNAVDVELGADPTYSSKQIKYKAIDLKKFMRDLLGAKHMPPAESNLLFEALDGFQVVIPAKLLFYTHGLDHYLAIENPSDLWPKLKKKDASAGPFYLIWQGNTKNVGQEDWPFMVNKIMYKKRFEDEYPKTVPSSKDKVVLSGYQVFKKNCFACHAFNGDGGNKMGPDMNMPHSPSEYMVKKYFIKYVRNPQSLRKWQGSQMSSFTKAVVSDKELDALWQYMKHMAEVRD